MPIPALANYAGSQLKLYKQGIEVTRKLYNLVAMPDMSASEVTAYHSLYVEKSPEEVKGINYPKNFKYLSPAQIEHIMKSEEAFCDAASEEIITSPDPTVINNRDFDAYCNLFYPLFVSTKGSSILSLLAEKAYKTGGNIFRQRKIEVNPSSSSKRSDNAPSSFLPKSEWFDAELDDLTIEDILTIFPEHEKELMALAIGRTVCGSNGTEHAHTGKVINHAYRSFILVQGAPQIGKSSLMTLITNAIESVGYTVANFNSLNKQFGLNEIAESDMAYSDDLQTAQLKKILESPLFKQMISGSKIRSEVKFASDVEVKSKAAFFACINKFDFNLLYQVDDGSINRLCILQTRTRNELDEYAQSLSKDSLSYGSSDLRPFSHVKYLAEKTGTSVEAVMLKFLSLCSEKFMQTIEAEKLDSTVNDLKTKLKLRLHQNIGANICILLQLAYCLRYSDDNIGQLNPARLLKAILALNFLINDLKCYPITKAIKQHWNDKCDRTSDHPWIAIEKLDTLSVASSAKFCADNMDNEEVTNSLVNTIKGAISEIRLNTGFNFPANVASIKSDWNQALQSRKLTTELIDHILDSVSDEELEIFTNLDTEVDIDWIFKADYDRQAQYDKLNGRL